MFPVWGGEGVGGDEVDDDNLGWLFFQEDTHFFEVALELAWSRDVRMNI